MASNHRIIVDGGDWMRDQERRVARQERRPSPPSFLDQLGPGVTRRARQITDWSAPEILSNGWYFTTAVTLNSPSSLLAWIGEVVVTPAGHGVQRVWSDVDGVDPVGFTRRFHYDDAAPLPVFTPWRQFAGPAGGMHGWQSAATSVSVNTWTTLTNLLAVAHNGVPGAAVELTSSSAITVHQAGWYSIGAVVSFPPYNVDNYTAIAVDGTRIFESGPATGPSVSAEYPLTAGQVVTFQCWQSSAGPLDTVTSVRTFWHIRRAA